MSYSMSREMPMMMTRIQYWKIPLTSDTPMSKPASSKMKSSRKPYVSVSTPYFRMIGIIAAIASFNMSAPNPLKGRGGNARNKATELRSFHASTF